MLFWASEAHSILWVLPDGLPLVAAPHFSSAGLYWEALFTNSLKTSEKRSVRQTREGKTVGYEMWRTTLPFRRTTFFWSRVRGPGLLYCPDTREHTVCAFREAPCPRTWAQALPTQHTKHYKTLQPLHPVLIRQWNQQTLLIYRMLWRLIALLSFFFFLPACYGRRPCSCSESHCQSILKLVLMFHQQVLCLI